LAASSGWYAVRRRGAARLTGAVAGVLLVAGAVALIVLEGKPLLDLAVVVVFAAGVVCARAAFRVHVKLPPAAAVPHPVLFFNPRSGGGKAERFHLADEARRRGIEPVELRGGDDLEELVRAAVRDGAGALAMAGGDGSQAIVAKVAAELELPYACIPAGTRNHFALDLGVDREDVVGALDALVSGGERRVDLAEVNGRVFVNNVSLGLYAEAVQKSGYRDAKLRTLLDTVPDALGPATGAPRLRWVEPDGDERSGAALLVSNNRYRLGRLLGSGTRPRLDRGVLGIAVFAPAATGTDRSGDPALRVKQWTATTFEVRCEVSVPAGIDGEATILDPPLRFRMLPAALRVRIACEHPGASPSALEPDSLWGTVAVLGKLAFGRNTPTAADQQRPAATGADVK
jgi:diacylglycerol kinase family enzyme